MDAVARALAEPTRREILRIVRDDEATVSQIAENFTVSRPAVSQHLRVLQEADLVTVRAEGTRRYYRTRPEGLGDLRAWLDEFWVDRLQSLKTEVEQEQWRERKAHSRSRTAGSELKTKQQRGTIE
ncbi:MAG: ArsR/SmtB family transcription factor [Acidimicrobiales bacterium]